MKKEKAIDAIIQGTQRKKIVPILGNNVFFIERTGDDGKKERIPFLDYVTSKLLSEDINEQVDIEKINHMGGVERMTRCGKLLNGDSELNERLNDIFTSDEFTRSLVMADAVQKFIKCGEFQLIITASILPADIVKGLIQKASNRNDYGSVSYRQEKRDDIKIDNELIVKPTIFHLFGGFSVYANTNLLTESDLLTYLHCLNNINTAPENLRSFLRDKSILALGCDVPDWTFRFMLYSLKAQDNSRLVTRSPFGGGVLGNVDEKSELKEFLEEIKYYSDDEINAILDAVSSKLDPIQKVGDNPVTKVFISYSVDVADENNDADYNFVMSLKRRFETESGLRTQVFVYNAEKDGGKVGDDYWNRIEDSLRESKYFIPFITPYLIQKLVKLSIEVNDGTPVIKRDESSQPGVISEWLMALNYFVGDNAKKQGKKIIAFVYSNVKWSLFRDLIEDKASGRACLKPLFSDYAATHYMTIENYKLPEDLKGQFTDEDRNAIFGE